MHSRESPQPEKRVQEMNPRTIEDCVNHECNDSLLLFERLTHPIIKAQLIHLLESYHQERERSGIPQYAPVWNEEKGAYDLDEKGYIRREKKEYVAPSREEIERQVDADIELVQRETGVTFTGQEPSPNSLDLNWKMPNGEIPNTKQRAITEAHEKGHQVRSYPVYGSVDPIGRLFQTGFDMTAVEYSQELFEQEQSVLEPGTTYEDAREHFYRYLWSPCELAERMSQLKNYFGMRGEEEFTREHLEYARKHYVDSTGFDNRMTHFFQSITPEKEKGFLALMNSVGI